MMDPYSVIRTPLLTEKCHDLKEKNNKVAFKVATTANKVQVKEAVEKIFKVKVQSVNVMNVSGKTRRMGRHTGRRPDWKKAIVRLQEGHDIDLAQG